MRVFATLFLERDNFRSALLRDDLGADRGTLNDGRSVFRLCTAKGEYFGEGHACALVAFKALNVEHVVFRDLILLAARTDNREHTEILKEYSFPQTETPEAEAAQYSFRPSPVNPRSTTAGEARGDLLPGTCPGCTPIFPNLQVASMAALLDRLYNLHWVTEDVARSAQPYIGFYKTFLRAHGFRAIINLRGENPTRRWWQEESRAAEGLNLRYFNVRLSSRLIPARASLIELAEAFDLAPRPILVKCSGGQDRASFAAAVYLLLAGGEGARAAAEAQFALWPYLHRPRLNQRWMRRFPAFAGESIGQARFDEWLKWSYDPAAFAEWLSRNGAAQSFLALQKV